MWKIKHVPVLWKEVLENLPLWAKSIMDGTVWHAGHSKLILENTNANLVAVDRDPIIINIAKEVLKDYEGRVEFISESYQNLDVILKNRKLDAILLDIWVNMEHFKDAKRWFSIKRNWPLDMRFDINQKITAEYVLKNYNQKQLENIFETWWDFKWKILKNIVRIVIKNRHKLKTTFELKEVLKQIWLSEKKIAVVFQSLRIEVNKELEQLINFLNSFDRYLNSGGRCLIITYHSIEDRLVKNRFKELDKNGFKNLTKKVIFPTMEEIQTNKASSSAKLRIIEKI